MEGKIIIVEANELRRLIREEAHAICIITSTISFYESLVS